MYSPVAYCRGPPNSIFSEICHPISNYSHPLKLRFLEIKAADIPISLPILRSSWIIPLNFTFFSYFPTIHPYPPTPQNLHPHPQLQKLPIPLVITPQPTIRDGRARFLLRNWSIRNWIYRRLRFKKLESCKFKILESWTTLFLGNLVRGEGQKFLNSFLTRSAVKQILTFLSIPDFI